MTPEQLVPARQIAEESAKESANSCKEEAEDKLFDRLVALRDKHLEQLMEINAKAAIAVLTAVFAVLVGASKAQGVLPDTPSRKVIVVVTIIAVLLLARGAYLLSDFHTRRIRSIQRRLRKNQLLIRPGEFEVIPRSSEANSCVYVGLLLLAGMALCVFYGAATQAPTAGSGPVTIYSDAAD